MCAPISATVASSISSASFATSVLINQILAFVAIVSIFGYKVAKIVKLL